MFRFVITMVASFFCLTQTSYALDESAAKPPVFELAQTEIHSIRSKVLGRTYDVYIKFPNGYFNKENTNKNYPIIYTNDGPFPFKVAASVTHLNKMNKAVVVGLSFAHGENGMASRVRDLTPVEDKSWVKYTTGGAGAFLKFMETELFPFVEKKYRIDVTNRILAGQSLGGSFGAWVLLTKPHLFKSYILTSPSLWFKDKMIFDLEAEYAAKHKDLKANVFMATGEFEMKKFVSYYDMAEEMTEFAHQLRSRNYPNLKVHDEVISGAIHENTFPIGLSKGLLWIFSDFYKFIPKE